MMINLIEHPKRRAGLIIAALVSVLVHVMLIFIIRAAPVFQLAMHLREIQFVDEDYNHAILITFSKQLSYPSGYIGFRPPEKTKSLEEIKKEEERAQKRKAQREAERQKREEARLAKEREEIAKREAEEKASAEQIAKAETPPAPVPTPRPATADGYGAFGKINTAPIKDQVKQLYDAKKEGKLALPEGKFKVGAAGEVKDDGTLTNYRITTSSGIPEIDKAALAILAAVSESKALGPLHQLNSLTMVLEIDQTAQLIVTGITDKEEDAINITNLAQAALLVARFKKSGDVGAMAMLNNLKVTRSGQRIQAVISMPREKASETLTKTMDKGQG